MTGTGSAARGDRPALERAVAEELTRRARYREATKAGRLLEEVLPECEEATLEAMGHAVHRMKDALRAGDTREAVAWMKAYRTAAELSRDMAAWQRERSGGAWDGAEWMRQMRMLEAKVAEAKARGEGPDAAEAAIEAP